MVCELSVYIVTLYTRWRKTQYVPDRALLEEKPMIQKSANWKDNSVLLWWIVLGRHTYIYVFAILMKTRETFIESSKELYYEKIIRLKSVIVMQLWSIISGEFLFWIKSFNRNSVASLRSSVYAQNRFIFHSKGKKGKKIMQ